MKCPLCSKDAPDSAEECPSCGAIFAKLLARRERERVEAAASLAKLAAPATVWLSPRARQFRWVVAAALVAGWLLVLELYYYPWILRNRQKRQHRASTGSTATMRGPAAGR